MSEMYNQIMELFGSCQEKNISLAEQLIEGQGIDKWDFLEHLQLVRLFTGRNKVMEFDKGGVTVWEAFLNTCKSGLLIKYAFSYEEESLNIEPVKHFRGLNELQLCNAEPEKPINLAPISHLRSLKRLYIGYSTRDIQPAVLSPENQIDLSPLAGLPNLERLEIDKLNVRDISVIETLPNLKQLHIAGCRRIKSFSPLKACKKLEFLRYSYPWGVVRNNTFLQFSFDEKIQKMVPHECYPCRLDYTVEHLYIDKPRQPRIAKRNNAR